MRESAWLCLKKNERNPNVLPATENGQRKHVECATIQDSFAMMLGSIAASPLAIGTITIQSN
jgi:hypothetical protein